MATKRGLKREKRGGKERTAIDYAALFSMSFLGFSNLDLKLALDIR